MIPKKKLKKEPKKEFKMNLDSLDEILTKGWPLEKELNHIPFGDKLRKLGGCLKITTSSLKAMKEEGIPSEVLKKLEDNGNGNKEFRNCMDFTDFIDRRLNEKESSSYRKKIFNNLLGEYGWHVRQVLSSMNKLLSESPVTALADSLDNDKSGYVGKFLDAWGEMRSTDGIFSKSLFGQERIEKFLRIASLYHDIGKVIQRDRHPLEGYHYIAHVKVTDAKGLKGGDFLGEDGFHLLCEAIQYHDLFGVIETGEGSAPVLIDALPFRSVKLDEQKMRLSLLLFINLADISGVIPLTSLKAGTLASDWKRLCGFIDESGGNRQEFARLLIRSEQDPRCAIERIRRLLLEGPPESLKTKLNSSIVIQEVLEETLGTQFHEFWSDFALVCKLDYALRFIKELEKYAAQNKKSAYEIFVIVVSLLKRLVQDYSALTRRNDGTRRRIGIEVSGWTRTPDISRSLIELLFKDLSKGVGWAAEEATAWYLE
ncbi:MAG: HD domain-containing protein [Chloroflexi bacterium]|nr:HD domain-containing protein [Chloroflexota bacterium]